MGIVRDVISLLSRRARAERNAQHEIRRMALDRAKVRMQKAWEAADRDRFRGEKWMTSQPSITSEMEIDLTTLWDRAEDRYRNDPFAASVVNGRTDNVIGSGMSFHSRIKRKAPWYVRWREPGGQLRSKSFGKSAEAKRFKKKVEAELLLGQYDETERKTWAEFRAEYQSLVMSRMGV